MTKDFPRSQTNNTRETKCSPYGKTHKLRQCFEELRVRANNPKVDLVIKDLVKKQLPEITIFGCQGELKSFTRSMLTVS